MVGAILPDNPTMRTRRFAAATAAALTLAAAGCGTSGGSISRPIETLIYVLGAQGATFEFAATADADACGSTGTGIQSPNADHQFGDRVFQAPHLFVLENTRQPVRAVIRNTSPTLPITAFLVLGQVVQVGATPEGTINPGECKTIIANDVVRFPTPQPSSPEIRVEVCAPRIGDTLDLTMQCQASTDDWNWGYFLSIGDVRTSNISTCQFPFQPPFTLDACQAPSTIFVQSPKDQINAAMSVNPGQSPGGQNPTAQVRVELFVNGVFTAADAGVEAIVSANL
jgi:hypothetical protein